MEADNIITVTVAEARLEEALGELKKLNRKAERYGTARIEWTLDNRRQEEVTIGADAGRKAMVWFVDIVFTNPETPKVGDFQFIARLEHTEAGVIIDSIPGEELPKRFREASRECEHCHHERPRKHLYVVRDPEGNLVQVGRTCLRDYMGTDTPAGVAARFRWLREVQEWGEDWGLSAGRPLPDSADELLAVTACAIRLWGWVAKSNPDESLQPTAFAINPWFYCLPGDKHGQEVRAQLRAAIREEDWDMARAAMEWVASEEAGDSEYIHNLRMVLAPGAVPAARRGIACSAVSAYQRHLGVLAERQREAEAAASSPSRHLGAVGERLRGLQLRCDSARGIESQWGTTILYKFHDQDGNVLTWFSSGGAELEPGAEYLVDATVKAHGEFRGVAETTLTRAKVNEEVQA